MNNAKWYNREGFQKFIEAADAGTRVVVDGVKAVRLKDACGNTLEVRENGEVYRLDDNMNTVSRYMVGKESSRKNGYTVAVFWFFSDLGHYEDYKVQQHRAVAICFDHEGFSKLAENYGEYGLEVNHMDGCRWHNNIGNLEWVTPRLNYMHGKMLNSIKRYYPELFGMESNAAGEEDVYLRRGLSAYYVDKFEQWASRKNYIIKETLIDDLDNRHYLYTKDSVKLFLEKLEYIQ